MRVRKREVVGDRYVNQSTKLSKLDQLLPTYRYRHAVDDVQIAFLVFGRKSYHHPQGSVFFVQINRIVADDGSVSFLTALPV